MARNKRRSEATLQRVSTARQDGRSLTAPLEEEIVAASGDAAAVAADLAAHEARTDNPHSVTAAQVGAPPTSRQVISGAGLTGGGDLSADRTLAVGAGTGIAVNADDVALDTASSRNVDHAAVSISAGTGLTGGGTIAATRTLSADFGAVAGKITEGNDARLSDARTPTAHATSHEAGGSDVMDVSGLSGLLADPQGVDVDPAGAIDGDSATTPLAVRVDGVSIVINGSNQLAATGSSGAHAATHEDGGADEIDVTGLSGVLADPQTPAVHHTTHENGGADEIDVTGLSGLLADAQTPLAHTHAEADVTGLVADLAAKAPNARQIISGGGLTGGGDLSADRTIAVGAGTGITVNADDVEVKYGTIVGTACQGNDARLSDARTPTAHAASHENGGGDEISVAGLSGLLADPQTALAGTARPTEETTTLTGTQNDYDLDARFTYLRCNNASALLLTGFKVAGGAPQAGDTVIIENVGTSTVRVAHQDTGSTAAYRAIWPSTRGQIVGANGRMVLVYDGTTSRWRGSVIDPGVPISIAYGSLTFAATSGTWTVESGDLIFFRYQQRGRVVTWFLQLSTTTVSGAGSLLSIQEGSGLPGGFTGSDNDQDTGMGYIATGVRVSGLMTVNTDTLYARKTDASSWGTGTNDTYIRGIFSAVVN